MRRNPRVLDPKKKRRYFEYEGLVHVITEWETQGRGQTIAYLPCEPVYCIEISPGRLVKSLEPMVPTCFVCALA